MNYEIAVMIYTDFNLVDCIYKWYTAHDKGGVLSEYISVIKYFVKVIKVNSKGQANLKQYVVNVSVVKPLLGNISNWNETTCYSRVTSEQWGNSQLVHCSCQLPTWCKLITNPLMEEKCSFLELLSLSDHSLYICGANSFFW